MGRSAWRSDLADHGIQTSICRIKRIRRRPGLRCKQKRKFKATTNSSHALPLAPHLLDQQFSVATPNRAWVTDMTCVATDEGWFYLAGVKDLFNGELAGYAISKQRCRSEARAKAACKSGGVTCACGFLGTCQTPKI